MTTRYGLAALATAVVITMSASGPAAAYYHGDYRTWQPRVSQAQSFAWAECRARFSWMTERNSGPKRFLAIEGCVQDILRR